MTTILDPVDLRTRGFAALVDSLGWVNAVRFLHQFEKSTLDYTAERQTLLPDLPTVDLLRRAANSD